MQAEESSIHAHTPAPASTHNPHARTRPGHVLHDQDARPHTPAPPQPTTRTRARAQVMSFAAKMHALADESSKARQPAALEAFREELAEAAARGTGARWVCGMPLRAHSP